MSRSHIIWIFIAVIVLSAGSILLQPYEFQQVQEPVRIGTDGRVLVGEKHYGYQEFDEIPEVLHKMLVSIEDRRFYHHFGIDPYAIGRAVWVRLMTGDIQGGSTIHQQLVKIDQGNYQRTYLHKLQEILGATQLGLRMGHKEILRRYINIIPWKNNVQGWRAACQTFLDKSCANTTKAERYILLAAAQRGYDLYDPEEYEAILKRAKVICNAVEADKTVCQTIGQGILEDIREQAAIRRDIDPKIAQAIVHDYPEEVYNKTPTSFDYSLYQRIDTILDTTYDARMQRNAQHCCVVVLNEKGDLVSMNVCNEWSDQAWGKVNACFVPRQTGSAIKPFLYSFALKELGWGFTDTIVDEYVAFDLGGGAVYEPKNFDLQYHGEVTLATALGSSLNIPAVKLLHQVGVEEFITFLEDLLLVYGGSEAINEKTAEDVGLSAALGTYEIAPYYFTKLWQFFMEPKISMDSEARRVVRGYEKVTQEVVEVLEDTSNKTLGFGQDSFVYNEDWAIKTGTSRKFVDGWICGLSQYVSKENYIACLWLGNLSNATMQGSSSEVGGFIWSQIVDLLESY